MQTARIHRFTLTVALLSLGATSAQAHTFGVQNFTCPLDGEVFEQQMDMSGTQFGTMLDLKPIGPIAAPWSLPVCPSSQFVMYRTFTPEEIEILKRFVASTDYINIKDEAIYYRVAQLKRLMQEPAKEIAMTLLQATWQARSNEEYARYAKEALVTFNLLLIDQSKGSKDWITNQLIILELERRLSLFEAAEARLASLKTTEMLGEERYVKILELQAQLIMKRDNTSQPIPK